MYNMLSNSLRDEPPPCQQQAAILLCLQISPQSVFPNRGECPPFFLSPIVALFGSYLNQQNSRPISVTFG